MKVRAAMEADYPHRFLEHLEELEKRIDYSFRDQALLRVALTHSSFSNERKNRILFEHNERLEFLGDSVLSLVVSRRLFSDHTAFQEGVLTKLRAALVCAEALFEYAESIGLGSFMLLNHGLEDAGGRGQKNVLADCFEALLAAVYLDGGLDEAQRFVLTFVEARIPRILHGTTVRDADYKSLLQEKVQTSPGEHVEYRLVEESGPDHHKVFTVEVLLNSNVLGRGDGPSKREAEQAAAHGALTRWFGMEDPQNGK